MMGTLAIRPFSQPKKLFSLFYSNCVQKHLKYVHFFGMKNIHNNGKNSCLENETVFSPTNLKRQMIKW
jgi:hypothetical protein